VGLGGAGAAGRRHALPRAKLARVGLAGRDAEWPAVLSGGQKQRVALARALVARPPLLALDEPLGALDALTRIEMQALVEEVWREVGFTAILVTHDVGEAVALADRILLLDHGRVDLDLRIEVPRPRRRGAGRDRGPHPGSAVRPGLTRREATLGAPDIGGAAGRFAGLRQRGTGAWAARHPQHP
jgi:sulfonate transport system ATP-binding protein